MGVKASAKAEPDRVGAESGYAVDGLQPKHAVSPSSPEEVADQLRACSEEKSAVVVFGGATQMALGSAPLRYDVALSTKRLNRLLEHEPADLTCSVQAGMTMDDLRQVLVSRGQRLPIDPPHPERATLGGTLAANVNGFRRARYGTVRDWVIGMTVAYPAGVLAKAGGKVVKNVAGYDLMKLHIGALGTLGVIVEVNLKLQTLPESEALLLAGFSELGGAVEVATRLARTHLMPAGALLLDCETARGCGLQSGADWVLALHFEGYRKEVEAGVEQASGFVREAGGQRMSDDLPAQFWDRLRDWPAEPDSDVVIQLSSSLTGLGHLLERAEDTRVLAQPTAGVAHLRVNPDRAAGMVARLRQGAGEWDRIVVTRAPEELKAQLDVWGPVPEGFTLMQEMKRTLDPVGILNPGRFVGGI